MEPRNDIAEVIALLRDIWGNYDHEPDCWLHDSPWDFDPESTTCRCCKAGTMLHRLSPASLSVGGETTGRPRTKPCANSTENDSPAASSG